MWHLWHWDIFLEPLIDSKVLGHLIKCPVFWHHKATSEIEFEPVLSVCLETTGKPQKPSFHLRALVVHFRVWDLDSCPFFGKTSIHAVWRTCRGFVDFACASASLSTWHFWPCPVQDKIFPWPCQRKPGTPIIWADVPHSAAMWLPNQNNISNVPQNVPWTSCDVTEISLLRISDIQMSAFHDIIAEYRRDVLEQGSPNYGPRAQRIPPA